MRRLDTRRLAAAAALSLLALLAPAPATAAPAPLLGGVEEDACVAATAAGGCVPAPGLGGGGPTRRALLASPDGRNVYYTAGTSNIVASLARDPATGRLAPVPDGPSTGDEACVGDGDPASGAAGAGGCVPARALANPTALAISPDGLHVYVASGGHDAIAILARDPATGALRPIADDPGTAVHEDCLASQASAAANGCVPLTTGRGLDDPVALAISRDGRHLYVAAADPAATAIGVLLRTPSTGRIQAIPNDPSTGAIDGCVAAAGGGGSCAAGNVAPVPTALAMAPDGSALYMASANGPVSMIAAYARDPQDGALSTPANGFRCVQDDDRTLVFTGCGAVRNLTNPLALAVSPDGRSLYAVVAGSNTAAEAAGVTAIDLPIPTAFAQVAGGCISRTGSIDPATSQPDCALGPGLNAPTSVAVSPDGLHVYAGAEESNALTAYARDAASGALTPLPDHPATAGLESCLAAGAVETAGCRGASLLAGPRALALSPDGAQLYAGGFNRVTTVQRELPPTCQPSSLAVVAGVAGAVPLPCSDPNGDALTVAVSAPARGVLGGIDQAGATVPYTADASFAGTDTLTFTASDGVLGSAPATASLVVAAPPPPPPTQPAVDLPPSFTLLTARVQGVRWRRSRLVAGSVLVQGRVTEPAAARITLRRATARRPLAATPVPVCRSGRACPFAAGTFTRRLPLVGRGRVLPGRFELRVGDARRVITIPAPAEGVVRSAEFRASRNGGAVTRLRGRRTQAWVVYRLAALPTRGPLQVVWTPPRGRPLIGDKPRSATVISNVRSASPLPAGRWTVTLRVRGAVVHRAAIRIG
jgi:DNA-binding beta-propeller fold protein YncE